MNDIFTQWCGIAFRLCEIILLDTSKVIRPTPQGPRRLSDHLTDDGVLVLRAGQPRFGEILDEIMTNGQAMAFIEKMRKKCVHIFFAHNVRDEADVLPEEGVGGYFDYGSQRVSYGVVDAGTARLAQTIAHEIGHALGEAAHSTQPNNLMQETVGEDDTRLESDQCDRILRVLQTYVSSDCP